MTTYLSQALTKYYERQKNKIVFSNKMSLNELAFSMWEKLGFKEIDASVISRVINGKRLFTPLQIDIFCEILKISKSEREALQHNLHLDHCKNYGVSLNPLFFNPYSTLEVFKQLTAKTYSLLYRGRCDETEEMSTFIFQSLKDVLKTNISNIAINELTKVQQDALYLKTRASVGVVQAQEALRLWKPLSQQLFEISNNHSRKYLAFEEMSRASAYYVSGNYSYSNKAHVFHKLAILYAKKAINHFSESHPDILFAYRTAIASAIFLKDQHLFESLSNDKKLERIILSLKKDYSVMAIHVYHTIARGKAVFHLPSVYATYDKAEKYFGDNVQGKGIHELADIRNELEILSVLKIKDKNYIEMIGNRGFILAGEFNSRRHTINIKKLLNKLLN